MTVAASPPSILRALDEPTRLLVRLSALVAAGTEADIRRGLAAASDTVPQLWVEELLLQSYLFAGFPRTLNAMREWRRSHPRAATPGPADQGAAAGVDATGVEPGATTDPVAGTLAQWRRAGEHTCAVVYGKSYERLRENIRHLHVELDDWMITDGYGKVLSRPGLDLVRRELCIVAACAAAGQERQLHSHLRGALNAGASADAIGECLDALQDVITAPQSESAHMLWARVRGK
ncbi:MAG TPA: carboxymuconolactone decarboxylase family protein [Gemmatimonadaceae bacterium]|nr:carboxymuconolactone decarboxylase family protein [Gemmatimonadaceae bacterium]